MSCVCKTLKAVNDEHLNMFDSLELGKAVLYYVTHVANDNNYGVVSLIMLIYLSLSCLQVFLTGQWTASLQDSVSGRTQKLDKKTRYS